MSGFTFPAGGPQDLADFDRRLQKLSKINAALMQRVERSMDQQANAFSLFQTAIALENQIKTRTEELKSALLNLETANEELKRARDAAERANLFKTRFFTAVGHDLLQPLHAARLSLSELTDTEQAPTNQRTAASISRALTSIEDLLTSILDISKLESGVFVPSFQPVALGEMFEQLAANSEPILRKKNLSLICRPTSAAVMSDPLMLRRILQNLLANSANYTGKGGLLLGSRRRGNMVRIEVWDTGPGISAAEHDRIFEEFQRGTASEVTGGVGFGLGLSIVKRMSEALNHPLLFCSRVGHGTMFAVSAPYAGSLTEQSRSPVEAVQGTPQSFAGLQKLPVLVIDNDLDVLEAMQALLDRWGCDVRLARDRDDISEVLSGGAFRPAVILADYHLDRGVSGLDLVAEIRHSQNAAIPSILITADRTSATANAAASAGLEILHKPIRPAELRALLQHVLK